ncbi:Rad17-domain-containing protein [Bimuria novae-zelandiae CBS 107.79]|uniref:Rad17-domain-containing protein n=1 Tax=Bimuria novae-zelandiae CBS 107.79 TaxID=1447943 RepID=A0A6A5VDQ5_9PLEO|nr:Rad17-domain-containing protein [Bimuria novae-zelandiae CBS 107.79]
MVKPRAARKKPVVVSSDSDEDDRYSPPAKRPKRGTLPSLNNGIRGSGDANPSKTQMRRAPSPKPSTSITKKSLVKSPAKSKVVSKPITSFFGAAPKPQFSQPTPSPEKTSVGTPVDPFDDIFDSSDDDRGKAQPTALPVRKGKPVASNKENGLKGSRRFLRTFSGGSGGRTTPAPSPAPVVDTIDRRPWNEKYGPTSLEELAVHKKKVSDVRTWLADAFSGKERKRMLLLKGPAGSGKTTTMALLSKEMGFHMHEWKNPTSTTTSPEGGFLSATAQFEDFVGRTGTFGSLTFDGPAETAQQLPNALEREPEEQLILVEEFPNTFTRTSSVVQSFRSSVLHYLAAATPSATAFFSGKPHAQNVTPIVMVVSETLLSTNTAAADSFTAHRLLGPEILTHPGVSVIEFNPIAPTFMTKALDLIVVKEARKSGRKKTVGPQVIQRLTELGDIRSAVSSLEFLCLRGDETDGWGAKVNFAKKKAAKDKDIPMTKMEQESLEMVTQRESTLGIFHAVGRVVYNKRHPEDPAKPVAQPPNYFPERRRPKASEVDIESLIAELGTDTQTFVAALHENYVLSCDAGDSEETLDCINGSIDALSDADLLSPDRFGASGFGRRNFQGTSADNLRQDEMSFQASVRGLLYNLPNPVKRVAPPPGVMGAKAKGAGAAAGAAKGSAYVMYYPSSLRLWRQQEEIGGLLELWISRAQRGELFGAHGPLSKVAPTVTGGVDTWRKTTSFASSSKPPPSSSKTRSEEETPTPVLGSGGSARYEMLLERLPYLPTILRKRTLVSSQTSATVQEIRKITAFTGSSLNVSAEDDDGDENEEAGEQEQWATDKPTPDTPRKKKRVRIETKEKEVESAIPGEARVMNLVLSDDDIED